MLRASYKPVTVLVDVDGTMALMKDRGPYEWDKVGQDLPNLPVIETVRALALIGWTVVYCSGRMEAAREGTVEWLDRYTTHPYDRLVMRTDGDYRPDEIVKFELFREHIDPFYDVRVVLDDRIKVVKMWRDKLKLPCFQVAEGNF